MDLDSESKIPSFSLITEIITKLSRIRDSGILIETALQFARDITKAEAGTVYIAAPNDPTILRFSHSQNDRLTSSLLDQYMTHTLPVDENSIAGYVALHKSELNIEDVKDLDPCLPYRTKMLFSSYPIQSMYTKPLQDGGRLLGVLQLMNAKDENNNTVKFDPLQLSYLELICNFIVTALERSNMIFELLNRTIAMTELRDPLETGVHIKRVSSYAGCLYELWATKRNYSRSVIKNEQDKIKTAALAHDIGKVGIPDSILKKPGKFTPEDFDVMKQHTYIGYKFLKNSYSFHDLNSALVCLQHHEWWNGDGYPGHLDVETGEPIAMKANGKNQGLIGTEIHFYARLVAIADVFDALSSTRVYKHAWERPEILAEFKAKSGVQFDPELTSLFLENVDIFYTLKDSITN